MDIGDPLIGYVVCAALTDGSFVGGALITDAVGLPIEFRHTEPLQPSRLQRVLYGRALDSYLYNEVVIGALLDALESAPRLLIAGDPAYLNGVARNGTPAACITEARNVPAKEVGSRQNLSNEEYILYLGPGNGPVRVHVSPSGADAASTLETCAQALLQASQTMEVVEPLRRVDEALRMVAEEFAIPRDAAA